MMRLYRFVAYLFLPFVFIGLIYKGIRNNRAYLSHWGERLGIAPKQVQQAAPFDLWIHAVSVGEVRAAVPLVNKLLANQSGHNILITTTTPTGFDMVKMMLANRVSYCYVPYDVGWSMRRFVQTIKPAMTLVMETEIWPNLIQAAKQAGSKLLYTNVRLSQRSYNKYARISSLIQTVLQPIDHFAVQGDLDVKHLKLLGVEPCKITKTGSIKFDVNMPASLKESAEVLRRQLGQDRLIWIAGSTREGEEGRLFSVYKDLKNEFPTLLMVLVPRHPERFDSVARKAQKNDLVVVRRTDKLAEVNTQTDVYLGDTMGELNLMYACSDVAYVGGSLVPFGGQNILEPCALGVPVLFGPHMFNFIDISRWTIREEAGQMVQNSSELADVLKQLLASPDKRDKMGRNGLRFIKEHQGALDKNFHLIKQFAGSREA